MSCKTYQAGDDGNVGLHIGNCRGSNLNCDAHMQTVERFIQRRIFSESRRVQGFSIDLILIIVV